MVIFANVHMLLLWITYQYLLNIYQFLWNEYRSLAIHVNLVNWLCRTCRLMKLSIQLQRYMGPSHLVFFRTLLSHKMDHYCASMFIQGSLSLSYHNKPLLCVPLWWTHRESSIYAIFFQLSFLILWAQLHIIDLIFSHITVFLFFFCCDRGSDFVTL